MKKQPYVEISHSVKKCNIFSGRGETFCFIFYGGGGSYDNASKDKIVQYLHIISEN